MKKVKAIILLCGILVTGGIFGQSKVIKKGNETYIATSVGSAPHVVCPFTEEPNDVYFPYKFSETKKVPLSDFVVQYQDFPPEAIPPFEYMISILEELFPSNVPINVFARYGGNSAGSLASAGPTDYINITGGGLPENAFFSIALAEKLLDESFNAFGEADIVVNVSSTTDWHYDFENPQDINGRFDFVTVVMHEIFHGLGFSSLSSIDGTLGSNRFGNSAHVYDRLIETGSGLNVVDDFENASVPLGSALKSNDLFFSSDFFNINFPNDLPQIYAPASFSRGSSISHIDQDKYERTENGLMTPQGAPNEIIHDPGLSKDILYDCGWSRTLLRRQHEIFEEDVNKDFEFKLEVLSDFGFDTSTLMMFYFEGQFNFLNLKRLALEPTGEPNMFSAMIEAPGEERTINYYYSVRDERNISVSNPFGSPTNFYSFTWGEDDIDPEISHVPIERINENEKSITITTTLRDQFTGIDTAFVVINLTGEDQTTLPLIPSINDFNSVIFEATYEFPRALDTLDDLTYRIFAEDASSASNRAALPSSGAFQIEIVPIPRPITTYLNNFNEANPGQDFVLEGFEIIAYEGFSTPALHSTHPYGDAASLGVSSFDFLSQLKTPIIVSGSNSIISFDEVALIEPGELGVPFPESEFWDYVVVEGRKLNGADWIPFINGWDIRANSEWSAEYTSSYSPCPDVSNDPNCISDGIGTEELMSARRIDMRESGDFVEGDTILVRFRLFSDPAAYGWGWAIDNLSIQNSDITTDIKEIVSLESTSLFPNPASNEVNVSYSFKTSQNDIKLRITDISGRVVYNETDLNKSTQNWTRTISTADMESGLYIVTLSTSEGDNVQKLIIQR